MKTNKIQKRQLLYKLFMIGSLVFFAMGYACVYLAQHPKSLERLLHLVGFNYHFTQSEEKNDI